MSTLDQCLSPSSSLPGLRALQSITESQLRTALSNLQTIYCPLRLPADFTKLKDLTSLNTDSGYASENELTEEEVAEKEEAVSILRLDDFERSFAVRWLTSLISKVDELPFTDEERSNIIDEASFILSSFSDAGSDNGNISLIREFSFPSSLSFTPGGMINVQLNDAPLSGIDHTDVGLQTWGASIIFSGLLCSSPELLGLTNLPPDASIIELGAGTGLVSLTLAKLFPFIPASNPSVTATDYHPAVLENLRANIATNFPHPASVSSTVKAEALDWSAPPESLRSSVHVLFASDVVYAPEHAAWLRQCAANFLAPDGLFWLIVTVRSSGKFAGIPEAAEAVFREENYPRNENDQALMIFEKYMLDKVRGIGREDEKGYLLFKIGWKSV